ncbi:MAG: hypothetical protein ACOYZ7_07795 [Chloroflexota bacterium]
MLKRWTPLLGVLLLGGLVACQTPAPGATPTSPPPTATSPPATATARPTITPAPTATTGPVASKPTPTPTQPWQIPEIQPDDWASGSADAGMVLVEYSDFQ